jgi:uncharacterized DUF497 family protein
MTSESEIRAILALQQEIEQKKSEVSKRLEALRQESEKAGKDTRLRFVVDGELWELDRWEPEERFARIARIVKYGTQIWVIIYTTRSENVRIISARRARKRRKTIV